MKDKLRNFLAQMSKRIKEYKDKGLSESDTKAIFIEPLLSKLGWQIYDIDEVKREYPVEGDKCDYALKIKRQPVLFIEVKSLTHHIGEGDEKQIANYVSTEGIRWCAVTNGREWRFYDTKRLKKKTKRSIFRLTQKELVEAVSKSEGKQAQVLFEVVFAKLSCLSRKVVGSSELEKKIKEVQKLEKRYKKLAQKL